MTGKIVNAGLLTLFLLSLQLFVDGGKIVDLTYDLGNDTPAFPGVKKFNITEFQFHENASIWIAINYFCTTEHIGTHVDAPYHFNQNGWHLNEIPIERFIAPAVVVDIKERAETVPDAQLSSEDLEAWEKSNGLIPNGSIVFLYSGWGKYWNDSEKYFGTATQDAKALHFPGFSTEAAEWLLKNRNIVAVGTDTISIDAGKHTTFPVHVILAKENIYNLENVANLDKLPAVGAIVHAMPIKIKGGTGAPARVIAILPE